VDREAGGPQPRQLIPRLTEEFTGPTVSVYRLDGTPAEQHLPAWRVILIAVAWIAAGAVLAVALLSAAPAVQRVRSKL
jgi:hypothetical protein